MQQSKPWTIVSSDTTPAELGPQNQRLVPGITNKSAGSTQLSAGLVVMPPGGVSRSHVHNKFEIIIFILEGWAASLIGPDLEPAIQGPGDFLFIPAGIEHLAVNLSETDRIVGVETRSDPHFNEDVELLPHLDARAAGIVKELRARHKAGEIPANWQQRSIGPYKYQEN